MNGGLCAGRGWMLPDIDPWGYISMSLIPSPPDLSPDLPSCLSIIRLHFARAFWNHTWNNRETKWIGLQCQAEDSSYTKKFISWNLFWIISKVSIPESPHTYHLGQDVGMWGFLYPTYFMVMCDATLALYNAPKSLKLLVSTQNCLLVFCQVSYLNDSKTLAINPKRLFKVE